MTHRIDVDALYAGFCAAVPIRAALNVREIGPVLLGTASKSRLSEYFEHPFILEAPDFVADAASSGPRAVRDATLAHLLSVLRSLAEVRTARSDPQLRAELAPALHELESARDRLIANVSPEGPEAFAVAEQRASRAVSEMKRAFARTDGATLSDYLLLTREIIEPRVQAARVLARTTGLSDEQLLVLERTLEAIWVARETERDADGWRHWRSGIGRSAWVVVCLARSSRGRAPNSEERPTEPDLIARMVHESGVLDAMHACAARLWDAAAHRATQLGAARIALWAKQRSQTCGSASAQGTALCLTPTG